MVDYRITVNGETVAITTGGKRPSPEARKQAANLRKTNPGAVVAIVRDTTGTF